MKRSLPQQLCRLFWVFVGAVVTGLGIRLILLSGAGADPLTMFEEGLAKTLGLDTGLTVWGVNMVFFVVALLVNRGLLGWGTLVTAFCIGPSVSFFESLALSAPASFPAAVAVNVLGVLVVGLGIAVYMSADYGMGALEAIMVRIAEKIHKPYGVTRVGMDCSWLVLGVLFGGTLGVGTVIGAFGVGLSMDFFYRGIKKYILRQA